MQGLLFPISHLTGDPILISGPDTGVKTQVPKTLSRSDTGLVFRCFCILGFGLPLTFGKAQPRS